MNDLKVGTPEKRWQPLFAKDGKLAGEVEIVMHLIQYQLKVDVVKAQGLKADDAGFLYSSSDPFAVVRHDSARAQTEHISENLDPVWNTTMYFSFFEKSPLTVEVLDYDMLNEPDSLGFISVPTETAFILTKMSSNDGKAAVASYVLTDKDGKAGNYGKIQIGITVIEISYTNWPPPAANSGELEELKAYVKEMENELAKQKAWNWKQEELPDELSDLEGVLQLRGDGSKSPSSSNSSKNVFATEFAAVQEMQTQVVDLQHKLDGLKTSSKAKQTDLETELEEVRQFAAGCLFTSYESPIFSHIVSSSLAHP